MIPSRGGQRVHRRAGSPPTHRHRARHHTGCRCPQARTSTRRHEQSTRHLLRVALQHLPPLERAGLELLPGKRVSTLNIFRDKNGRDTGRSQPTWNRQAWERPAHLLTLAQPPQVLLLLRLQLPSPPLPKLGKPLLALLLTPRELLGPGVGDLLPPDLLLGVDRLQVRLLLSRCACNCLGTATQ
eukprot:COSAG01_NODE_1876_length_8997_cov_11.629355_12_plen_184_part_00